MTIRIRRKDHRQKYRRWMKIELYNYNYSEEAKQESRESNAILGNEAFPNDGQPECYSCGQTIPHDQEETIPERVGETND